VKLLPQNASAVSPLPVTIRDECDVSGERRVTYDPVKPHRLGSRNRRESIATALELLKASPVNAETCCVRSKNRGKLCSMIFCRSPRSNHSY